MLIFWVSSGPNTFSKIPHSAASAPLSFRVRERRISHREAERAGQRGGGGRRDKGPIRNTVSELQAQPVL